MTRRATAGAESMILKATLVGTKIVGKIVPGTFEEVMGVRQPFFSGAL
jgi:hypothetical protein